MRCFPLLQKWFKLIPIFPMVSLTQVGLTLIITREARWVGIGIGWVLFLQTKFKGSNSPTPSSWHFGSSLSTSGMEMHVRQARVYKKSFIMDDPGWRCYYPSLEFWPRLQEIANFCFLAWWSCRLMHLWLFIIVTYNYFLTSTSRGVSLPMSSSRLLALLSSLAHVASKGFFRNK